MNHALDWIDGQLLQLESDHLLRHLVKREGAQQVRVRIDGRDYLNFASNDYLGLAGDRRIVHAVREAVATYGWGGGASPLITGHTLLHDQLEQAIACFENVEAALLFPTGYAANVGAITALVGRNDTVFSDARNHASIIDGCRLSGAQVVIYEHCDSDDLKQKMSCVPCQGKRLVVTDGLFSMDGDLAPLEAITSIAKANGAMLMVDEAHATGLLGPHGRGVCELCGVEPLVDVRVGTLSKALGTLGGFVAGSRSLIDWLVNRSRTYVFSTATPAAVAAAGLAALRIVQDDDEGQGGDGRRALIQKADQFRKQLHAIGFQTGRSVSQIIPVVLADPQKTMVASAKLREAGLLVPGIRPPTVPQGESLLRISLSTAHTGPMMDELVQQLERIAGSGS